MAQGSGRGRIVGDYLVGKQIGSGSFSLVWHARHQIHGTEVAIKEIDTSQLNNKLQDSLMSEIFILKRINHPNIIRLYDIIEVPGRIHIVLEYCKGGDLYMYIRQCERVPEAIARHFMQQLAAGLQVLRANNLIHRDLKPQNLLLSSKDDNAVLKIADFGFARSLQPRGLAETLCGSPLYMAPEIMQLQKYDAKADLWSVGAILFQLVTGRTPFTGNNQMQLLQNIVKSTELQFPSDNNNLGTYCKDLCQKLLRRNPVERLTFEEFFNHPFLSTKIVDESFSNLLGDKEDISKEDSLPFFLEDDSSGPERNLPFSDAMASMKFDLELALDARAEETKALSETSTLRGGNLNDLPSMVDQRLAKVDPRVRDSLELIDQDYVIVYGPPLDVSSVVNSTPVSDKPKILTSPVYGSSDSRTSMAIIESSKSNTSHIGSWKSMASAPDTPPKRPVNVLHSTEQLTDCSTRIKSLWQWASFIQELVHVKIEAGRPLEAFSVQLVILAIWKQALHICHAQAVTEDSSLNKGMKLERKSCKMSENSPSVAGTESMSAQVERELLREVEYAEELARAIEPGNTEMPDAIETIFQSALAFGKNGAVDELMGDMEKAAILYYKASRLLVFLLEAPSLILNPPFSLTNADRYRICTYIDVLNNRQCHSWSQSMELP